VECTLIFHTHLHFTENDATNDMKLNLAFHDNPYAHFEIGGLDDPSDSVTINTRDSKIYW
jgi:hypothetical protein